MEIKKFEEFCLIIEEEDKKSYSGSHGGLDRWFKEKWVDISKTNKDGSHPPCGRKTHQRTNRNNAKVSYISAAPLSIKLCLTPN